MHSVLKPEEMSATVPPARKEKCCLEVNVILSAG